MLRGDWERFREHLECGTRTLTANRAYNRMAVEHPDLAEFGGPEALVAFLTGPSRNLDAKDILYRILIRIVQARGAGNELAMSLVWLGLWPGLDAVYRRRLKRFLKTPEELVAEIIFMFTSMVGRIDIDGVARLAATLVMNVDRDVMGGLRRKWGYGRLRQELPEGIEAEDDGDRPPPQPDPRLLTEQRTDEYDLCDSLHEVLGPDAELVIGVDLYGYTQQEMSAKLGISFEACRKRYQRAHRKIEDLESRCPIKPSGHAFPLRPVHPVGKEKRS